jgi:hypothetical protein
LEDSWNSWYSGPKLAQMLAKPYFLSGQRFKAAALDETRRYLAVWHVESDQAFKTKEYTSDWGFFEWSDKIGDWSRDLFEVTDGTELDVLDVKDDEYLYVVSFEGLSQSEAERGLKAVKSVRKGVVWFNAVGLDKASKFVGIRKLTRLDADFSPLPEGCTAKETIFAPISRFANSPSAALEQSLAG